MIAGQPELVDRLLLFLVKIIEAEHLSSKNLIITYLEFVNTTSS
jgi:hypothetical protein